MSDPDAVRRRTIVSALTARPNNPLIRRTLDGEPWILQSGDLAVARSVVTILDGSPPVAVRFRNIHVLAKEEGVWKCVAWQVTKLT